MTSARAIEYRITRDLLQAAPACSDGPDLGIAERVISIAAVATGLLMFGSLLPELVVASLAGSVIWGLGQR